MGIRWREGAGPALAAAALGSFFAGTVATIAIAVIAKPLTYVALSFHSAEYFSLIALGLVSSVALASGSMLRAIGMIILGLLIGLTGTDIYTGQARFTFGQMQLLDGIDFAALAVGVFGVGEILRNLESSKGARGLIAGIGSLWPSREDLRRMWAPIVRGTAIGSILGVLPGGGATLSSYVAYNIEKKVSRNSSEFGKGAIEGVAAPESANNAGVQTAFIPMLSLGIPSNVVMALMLGAMMIQGIAPGPKIITQNPDLFWGVIASMWIGNAFLVILNLPLIGLWVRLLRVPYGILVPAIVIFCCIGVYSLSNSGEQIYQVIVTGVIGYLLVKIGCELAPFVLGFILGPMLEEHFRRAMIISHGDLSTFVTSPISAGLLLASCVLLIAFCAPLVRKKREEVFVDDE